MTFAEALRLVRPLIEDGSEIYTCVVLTKLGAGEHMDLITQQLNGCNSYETWLKKFHPHVCGTMTFRDFRNGRLQWIDHMISEEEKAGRG